jgi:hypothetical protein
MISEQTRHITAIAISIVALWAAGCHPFESTDDYPFAGSTSEDGLADTSGADTTTSLDGDDPDSGGDITGTNTDTDDFDTDTDDLDADTEDTDVITPDLTGEPLYVWSGRPDDSLGDGSPQNPFHSLEEALDAVREELDKDEDAQFVIFLSEGDYTIPARFLGHPDVGTDTGFETNPDPLNFTGVHMIGGFQSKPSGPLWDMPPDDAARSVITFLSAVDPLGFSPRPELGADFEGTALSHVQLIPSVNLDFFPYQRETLRIKDAKVLVQRSDIFVSLASGYSIGALVDSQVNDPSTGLPAGQLALDKSKVRFPLAVGHSLDMSGTSLYGVKTHDGVVAIGDSAIDIEQQQLDDFLFSFPSITAVYGEGPRAKLWLDRASVRAGFADSESVAISCVDGCSLNFINSEALAATKSAPDPNNPTGSPRQTARALGIQLYSAGRASITESRVNASPSDGASACQAQRCTGIEMWGTTFVPSIAQLDLGPQVSDDGFITSCDSAFFSLVIERSTLGGGLSGTDNTALFVEGSEDANTSSPLVCVNASRLDPGQCVDSFSTYGSCRGAVLHNPLIALIHNSVIYGGDALTESAAVEVSTSGTYRYVVLASNYLHGGYSDLGSSAALRLLPSAPATFDGKGDFTSGVLVVGNHIHPGIGGDFALGVEELAPFDSFLSPLRPLAFLSNNFQRPVASDFREQTLYRAVSESGQPIDLQTLDQINGAFTAPTPHLFFLNLHTACAPFDRSAFRANINYVPATTAACEDLGAPYKDLCDGDNPPEGVITWLPWGDIQGKPRVCQPLSCGSEPQDVCAPRWGGDHAPDIGPFERITPEPCACSL